ncbi:hypothetical protein MJO29_016134 [Puccinia striiformis f. sp. tritici]|nr:hypothetical protein MJO29_016134 [Puccinia striiformis f. sp. tritici]
MNSDCSGSHTNNNTYRAFGYHPHNVIQISLPHMITIKIIQILMVVVMKLGFLLDKQSTLAIVPATTSNPTKQDSLLSQKRQNNSIIPPRRYYLEKSQARQCGTNPTNDDTSPEILET